MTTMNIPVRRAPSFELTIDSRFEGLIPKVSSESFKDLETSIQKTGGPEMPLVVWGTILVDGHHRYRVCKKHGLPFATVSRDFETAAHAQLWAVNEHLTRRNMTSDELNAMRRRKVELLRETGLSKNAAVNQVAESENVHPGTIRRSAKNEELREKLLEKVPDDARDKVRSIPMSDLKSFAKLPVEKQKEVVEQFGTNGKRLSAGIKKALKELVSSPQPESEPTLKLPAFKPTAPKHTGPEQGEPEPSAPPPPVDFFSSPVQVDEKGRKKYLRATGEQNLECDVEQCIHRLGLFKKDVYVMKPHVCSLDQFTEVEQLIEQLYGVLKTWRGDVTRALEERKLKEQDERDASSSRHDEAHRLPKDRASPERVLQASR